MEGGEGREYFVHCFCRTGQYCYLVIKKLRGGYSLKKWYLLGLVAVLSLTLVIAGCASKAGTSGAASQINIGVSAPLTGDIAAIGQSTQNAATMAADEVNANGGLQVGNQKLKVNLIVLDDQDTPQSTADVFQKLINQDNVVGIIGSQASKCSNAGAPIAESAGVVMITPWSTNPQVTQGKQYVFRACFIDPFQGYVGATFARSYLKANTAAVLYAVDSDYNKGLAEMFRDNFTQQGGKIVGFETYTTGDKDFSAQLTRIKAQNPDVLYLPNYYNEVPLQIQQAKRLGMKCTFLGGDAWDSPDIFKLGGQDIEGTYFSNHYAPDSNNPGLQAFIQSYKTKYNTNPDAAGALTYDACRLLFQAITKAGSLDHKAIRDALAATTNFQGVTGTISYKGSGDPVKSAVELEITGGAYKFIETVNPPNQS